jgi:hypothetical protein
VCGFALPVGATSTLDDRQADCDKQCADAVQAERPPPVASQPPALAPRCSRAPWRPVRRTVRGTWRGQGSAHEATSGDE